VRPLAALLVALLVAAPAAAVCPGDCNGDGEVRINEVMTAVGIALGSSPVGDCAVIDSNADGQVTIAEIVTATNALLSGCPAVTPSATGGTITTATPTDTAIALATPTATPTATANQPPSLAAPFVYRGIALQPIARPLGATDPGGGEVACAGDALLAGMTLDPDNVLRWTPAADQVGRFTVPVQCQDAAEPPLATSGDLDFRITPADACTVPVCDPATGCTADARPVTELCCTGAPEQPRLPEAEVSCPQGRVLQIGRNKGTSFGPLQSCDSMRFMQRAQTSAEIRIHIRVSCVNASNRVTVSARLESAGRGVLVETRGNVFLPSQPTNGFYERRAINFPFSVAGPFLDIEDKEANLTVTVTDSDGVTVSKTVRVVLTSDPTLHDLPDP
jgi:hypothetical protein